MLKQTSGEQMPKQKKTATVGGKKEEKLKEDIDFIKPEEIWARDEYIFIAKKDSIDTKVYKIDGQLVEEKKSDIKIHDFDVYFPKESQILYFVLDEVVVLFGKDFSDESLGTLVGILNVLDNMVVNILKPVIEKEPKWYPDYVKRIKKVASHMETFLGSDNDSDKKIKK